MTPHNADAINAENQKLARAWIRHLTIERSLSTNTVSNYQRDVDRYLAWLGSRPMSSLSPRDLDDFVIHLTRDEGLAHSSAARTVAAVRGLHKFARAEGKLSEDVASGLSGPKIGRSLPKALTVAEVEELIEAIPSGEAANEFQLRDRALLEMLYSTGGRISEILDLDVDDVDTEDHMIMVRGKGAKERIVPLGVPALRALEAYLSLIHI